MNFGSLFSGIGLIDLGLERAGWKILGQCEIEPFGRMILEKHWPNVKRWNDVKMLTGQLIREQWGFLEALVAGVPCQPSSCAGERRGAADDRWLWPDYLRLVSEINDEQERPLLWLLAENPDDVLSLQVEGRSFRDWIEAQFQSLGYSLFVGKFGADCLGAPHERQRVWIVGRHEEVGHANGFRREGYPEVARGAGASKTEGRLLESQGTGEELANGNGQRQQQPRRIDGEERRRFSNGSAESRASARADAQSERLSAGCLPVGNGPQVAIPTGGGGYEWPAFQGELQYDYEEPRQITDAEIKSSLGFTDDGRSTRLARRWRRRAIEAIGNGAVVAAAEAVGRAILEADATA